MSQSISVMYGVAETPWNRKPWSDPWITPDEEWPRQTLPTLTPEQIDEMHKVLTMPPCAVCGFANAEGGDSHTRCREAIERAESRGRAPTVGEAIAILEYEGWERKDTTYDAEDIEGQYMIGVTTIKKVRRLPCTTPAKS